jgi:hypothetical protein
MRYRTAVISSVVLIGGMFGLPEVITILFLSSSEQGVATPVPAYERILLGIAVFGFRFRWVLAFPLAAFIVAIFIVAALTRADMKDVHPKSSTVPRSSV